MYTIVLLSALIAYSHGYGRHMPSYIKPCSKANIATCALENAKAAYPTIVKGDPEYDVPNLSPFHLQDLEVDAGENMVLKYKNLIVEGLEHMTFNRVDFDLDNKKADFELHCDVIYFQGHYEGGGKVYVLTVDGNGNSNTTFVGGTFFYMFHWDVLNINGEDHMVVKDPKLTMRLQRVHFDFENMSGVDNEGKPLDINAILNEHWELILEEVGGKISNTIEGVVTEILSGYFEHIPVKEMFVESKFYNLHCWSQYFKMKTYCLLFSAVFVTVASLHLPNYIIPCKKSDPKFDECVKEKATLALPKVAQGDKKFKSPLLTPLILPAIDVDAGPNLELKLKNIAVKGLDKIEFINTKVDLSKKSGHFYLRIDNVNFAGKYEINGQILVLPIKGEGDANITFVDGKYDYRFSWSLINKEGKDYAKIDNASLDMKLKKATFYLGNLFGGDKALGDNMNTVLNDNWEDVLKEIGVGISHTIEVVVTDIFKKYFESIPIDEIFID
ncbi:uncharacterized protein LOC109596678 [Aethina tumida]|uniref:uncharacterized protein LOC109596678 n=1 Tax=Aethina tumida TaxID=116153 RepID=UPI0021484A5D|nr:uncharacterized protein LOC109596678 [Aethina tumida]